MSMNKLNMNSKSKRPIVVKVGPQPKFRSGAQIAPIVKKMVKKIENKEIKELKKEEKKVPTRTQKAFRVVSKGAKAIAPIVKGAINVGAPPGFAQAFNWLVDRGVGILSTLAGDDLLAMHRQLGTKLLRGSTGELTTLPAGSILLKRYLTPNILQDPNSRLVEQANLYSYFHFDNNRTSITFVGAQGANADGQIAIFCVPEPNLVVNTTDPAAIEQLVADYGGDFGMISKAFNIRVPPAKYAYQTHISGQDLTNYCQGVLYVIAFTPLDTSAFASLGTIKIDYTVKLAESASTHLVNQAYTEVPYADVGTPTAATQLFEKTATAAILGMTGVAFSPPSMNAEVVSHDGRSWLSLPAGSHTITMNGSIQITNSTGGGIIPKDVNILLVVYDPVDLSTSVLMEVVNYAIPMSGATATDIPFFARFRVAGSNPKHYAMSATLSAAPAANTFYYLKANGASTASVFNGITGFQPAGLYVVLNSFYDERITPVTLAGAIVSPSSLTAEHDSSKPVMDFVHTARRRLATDRVAYLEAELLRLRRPQVEDECSSSSSDDDEHWSHLTTSLTSDVLQAIASKQDPEVVKNLIRKAAH